MSHILMTNDQFKELTKLVDDIKEAMPFEDDLHDRIDEFIINLCNDNIPDDETE